MVAIKAVVLVPERDNEGRAFNRHLWEDLDARLAAFGGLSKVGGVQGVWAHQGRVYRDRNYQYTSYLGSWLDVPKWLAVVRWIGRAFRQQAMAIEVAGVPEIVTMGEGGG